MKDQELVNALRYLCPGNFTCARCEYEPVCHGDGCAIIQKAADRIANQSAHIAALQQEIEKLRGQNKQLREAAALVAKESAELLERRWIPVEERLPENFQKVLCWGEYFRYGDFNAMFADYALGYQINGSWGGAVANGTKARALAWMPLPEPPEVDLCPAQMKIRFERTEGM